MYRRKKRAPTKVKARTINKARENTGEARERCIRTAMSISRSICVGSMLSLKDVEDSLEKFSVDDLLSVNQWVEDFEEMAEVWGWSDAHMVAYAKKLLAGSAQTFVRQERCAKFWAKLKRALRNEFENVVSDQQIHGELSHRKKKADESLQQYMYHMCGIAKQGRVDTQSLIDYIIQGIPDEVANKTVLYGARNIEQLKERFRRYEAIKRDMEMRTKFEEPKSSRVKPVAKLSETERNKEPGRSGDARKARCYNCGDAEHVCAECPSKSRGPKCFKCKEYGHIVSSCVNLGEPSKKVYSVFRSLQTRRGKDVKMENFELSALIDTGSELTLMRADQHVKIGAPRLSREIVGFGGVGSERNFTLGKFSTNIIIDNESYCITIHVVPDTVMQHSLIIGADFLDTVEISIKGGESFISRIKDENPDECPEVLKIDVETQASEIDLSHVKDMQHRLKRDLKRTKALLRDAQTMLERSKGDSTGKAALRQLKNQLEDAECARAVAVKAKQALEQEPNETRASLQEVLRQRSEAEDRVNVASRERTELLSQLEENKEELAEVLKKYRAAVQQVSEERRIVARHVVIGKVDHEMVSSSDSCGQQEDLANITRRKNLAKQQQQDVVDDICEFTEKDSVAGVRVVSSFRIDSKRVNARRTKRQGKSHARNPSNNIDTKIRYTEDVDDEDDDGIVEDTMNVKTFEKEEIIVSVDGKLLTSSMYEPSLRKCHDAATTIKAPDKSEMGKQTTERKIEEERKRSSSIEDEQAAVFQEERDQLRADAKRRIEEIQIRNKRAYNRRRKKATAYRTGDLVAIERMQRGPGLKLHPKFLGPYRVIKVLRNDRYIVQREGEHEGPRTTSTAADHMKWWNADDSDVSASGDDEHI
ncbi:uncharacterized protein LOC143304562 [Bombus vancouverensis nearcticus]|uniref:uncharacterized protein LOC143304562 n=1 Tax=Bombus vancouverensis nearcticus TaxID=2705178 RepID=UPI00402BA3CA